MKLLRISAVSFFLVVSSIVLAQSYSGQWEPADSTGFAQRTDLTASEVGGLIYAIGQNYDKDFIQKYDPAMPGWTTIRPVGSYSVRSLHTASVIDGKIYLIGGGNQDGVPSAYQQILDPVANVWVKDTIATPRFTERFAHTATVLDNKIYCIGGVSWYPCTNDTVEVYDPATRAWSILQCTGTFTPRLQHTASLIEGKIYIIGGHNGEDDVNSIQVLDVETATWSTIGILDSAIHGHCAIVYDNKIFIIGGRGGDVYYNVSVFDPLTLSWSPVSTSGVFTKRDRFAVAQLGNKIYAIGGSTKNIEALTLTKSHAAPDTHSSITVTPNPTDGVFSVGGIDSFGGFTVTNVLGEIVLQSRTSTGDLTSFPAGSYTISILSEDRLISRKLVVQ